MEEHKIKEAFRLVQNQEEKLDKIIADVTNEFLQHIKQADLLILITAHPTNYGDEFFLIGEDMNQFFRELIPSDPHKPLLMDFRNPQGKSRQMDYLFISKYHPQLGDGLGRSDGILIFCLPFRLFNPQEEYDVLILNDVFDTGKYGLVKNKYFKFKIIMQKVLDFFDFLYTLFSSKNYWGDIRIILEVYNIKGWKDPYGGAEFRQDQVYPIESVYNLEDLNNNQFDVLKTMFNNVFNGFGWSGEYKEEFIEEMKK